MSRSWNILAENLKRLRESHQYPIEKVAEAVDCTKGMVSRYENGKAFPAPHTIDKFADLYRMSIAALFSPKGAVDKAADLMANEQTYLDAANARLKSGEWELRKVKTARHV